ncbi:MAG TPA: NYN domain-containing protein, partial [Myxococcota bacterium]|nr:NYN domain-containing protein [Myxococcota bacterium]
CQAASSDPSYTTRLDSNFLPETGFSAGSLVRHPRPLTEVFQLSETVRKSRSIKAIVSTGRSFDLRNVVRHIDLSVWVAHNQGTCSPLDQPTQVGLQWGYFSMRIEPQHKRAFVFFDGQNLFHSAKEAFGYSWPNFDPARLARWACLTCGCELAGNYFYTGVPDRLDDATWNAFWVAKLAAMGTRGIRTFQRSLRYRNQTFVCPDGKTATFSVAQEKGIDIRLALDVVRHARQGDFDVGIVFSQDQDLSEVADEVRAISLEKNRWIRLVSAYPVSPTSRNKRGINGTDWLHIDRVTYEACLDPSDYRPAKT